MSSNGTLKCVECNADIKLHYNYCPVCGSEVDELQKMIGFCFWQGFRYKSILLFIKKYLDVSMSMRTLKTRLKSFGLKRKNLNVNEDALDRIVSQKIGSSQCLLGYRMMWNSLKLQGFVVPRRHVADSLKRVDPDGCALRSIRRLRRRKYFSLGSNYSWHLDGYDKLKPFGFPIHGCIDGYSRYVVWLELLNSNNNPVTICKTFLQAVSKDNACPRMVRTDRGTENVILAAAQSFFANSMQAHAYGPSHHNQRIEAWWANLKKSMTSWWINFFKDLIDEGVYDPSNLLQLECMRFCFKQIIQRELDQTVASWNSHCIRKSRHDTVSGIPNELYFIPESNGAEDHKVSVEQSKVDEVQRCLSLSGPSSEHENLYQDYYEHIVELLGCPVPANWQDALNLYKLLARHA